MWLYSQRTSLVVLLVAAAAQLSAAAAPPAARKWRHQAPPSAQPASPPAPPSASQRASPALGSSNDVPPSLPGVITATSAQKRQSVAGHALSQVNLPSPTIPQPFTDRLTGNRAAGVRSLSSTGNARLSNSMLGPRESTSIQGRIFPTPRGFVGELQSEQQHRSPPVGSMSRIQSVPTRLQKPSHVSQNLQTMHQMPMVRLTNVSMTLAREGPESKTKSFPNTQTSVGGSPHISSITSRAHHQPLTKASVHNDPTIHQKLIPNIFPVLPNRTANLKDPHKTQPLVHESKMLTTKPAVLSSDIPFKVPASHANAKPRVSPYLDPQRMLKKVSAPGMSVLGALPVAPTPSRSREIEIMHAQRLHAHSSAARNIQSANPINLMNGHNIPNINRSTLSDAMKSNGESVKIVPHQRVSMVRLSPMNGQRSAPFPRVHNALAHLAAQGSVRPGLVPTTPKDPRTPALEKKDQQILPPKSYLSLLPPHRSQNTTSAVQQNLALNPSRVETNAPRNVGISNIPKTLFGNLTTSRESKSGIRQDITAPKRMSSAQQQSVKPPISFPSGDSEDRLKKVSREGKINSTTGTASLPPDSNENPLNIAFANSAVPNYVLKAPTPVIHELTLPRGAGVSGALIPNYFIMNPLRHSENGRENAPQVSEYRRNSSSETTREVDGTLQDLHQDWKSEVFNRYYSTIGAKTNAEQKNLQKAFNITRKTSNRTLTEAAALLNKNSNMTNLNESYSLNVKNITDLPGVSSVFTEKSSNGISEAIERFSRNANLSSHVGLYAEGKGANVTEKYYEVSSTIPTEMNISVSNEPLVKNDKPTPDLKHASMNKSDNTEKPPNTSIGSNSSVNVALGDNFKNISLDSAHNVFPPLSNNSLFSGYGANLTSDLDTNTERQPDTTPFYGETTDASYQVTMSSLSTPSLELEVNQMGDAPTSSSDVYYTSNFAAETEKLPETTTSSYKEPTEVYSPVITTSSLSTTASEVEVNETKGLVLGKKLIPYIPNFTPNIDIKTETSLETTTFSYEQATELYIPVTTNGSPTTFTESATSKMSGVTGKETLDSLNYDKNSVQREIPNPPKSNAETSVNRDESIPKAISSNPENLIQQPRVKEPTRQVLINNTGVARNSLKLKPEERRVVVTLVDKKGRKIYVPAVFTPTDSTQTSKTSNGLSAIPVKENAVYISTTLKPSVQNTADESKIKDSTVVKEEKPESTTRRSLLDAIFRRSTTTKKTTISTTTPRSTTRKITTAATKKVTNVIDLIWESVTRTPALTTTSTTTTSASPVTNLIDRIWASVTEASSAANEVTPRPKIETTTTYVPGVTNLIDLIWASVANDSAYSAETTERTRATSPPTTVSSSADPVIPVLQDVIDRIDKRLNELQREITNGNTSLAEELNLLAAQMVQGSGILSQIPVQTERQRTYLVPSEDEKERTPLRFADIVEDTPLNPVLTLLREEVNRGAERVRQEVSFLAEDTAESLRRGVEDASERVSRITATSYRGALQTRDALVGLLGSALENMSVYVSKVLQDSIQTAFGTARSVGDFIRGLNENLVGGILRQGRAVRNLFSDTIEQIGQASDRTIDVVNRVVEKNLRTITEEI